MENSDFEISLSGRKMKNDKTYREKMLEIVSYVCALLNSNGGKLNLHFEDDPVPKEEVDRVLRGIEQRLVDIIGSCAFNSKVKVLRKSGSKKQTVIIVDKILSLCTLAYHLYLATSTQVIPISPLEPTANVKTVLGREVRDQITIQDETFMLKQVLPPESVSRQFKQLKAEKSKCVSLADRMTNKSNKLERYMSAFANKDGGQIFYGITDDGTVNGEIVGVKDQEEIVKKVTKTINQMLWCGGVLERGKHWDIHFVPVKNENMKKIPSLFVVKISVAPLRGGLFIQEPESYHVDQGQVKKMSFDVWKRRFFNEEQPSTSMAVVSSFRARSQWSSVQNQKIYHKVLQQLVKYQNDADFSNFEKAASLAKRLYADTDIAFLILAEEITTAYKRGEFVKAHSKLDEYEKRLSQSKTKDHDVLSLRAVYAKSAITRAEGNYQESYGIAQEGLQLAEIVPAGILTAWFYNHVAIVEKHLSQQTKDETGKSFLVKFSLAHFIKALQHTQASSIEQKFSTTIADSQQRIHIFRTITLLGDFASGANFQEATPSDITDAETDLIAYHGMVLQGVSPTNYRTTYHLFSLSDLRMCQWWQQQQQQETGSSEIETLNLLREAFDYAAEAKTLSMKFHFEELKNYANKRLAVITEMMVKRKVSNIRLPSVNSGQLNLA